MIWALLLITISTDGTKTIHKETIGYYETYSTCVQERDKSSFDRLTVNYLCAEVKKPIEELSK